MGFAHPVQNIPELKETKIIFCLCVELTSVRKETKLSLKPVFAKFVQQIIGHQTININVLLSVTSPCHIYVSVSVSNAPNTPTQMIKETPAYPKLAILIKY
jgi:hypothetical protein